MQGWHCGKGLIYLTASISANKITPPQSHFYTDREGKYYSTSRYFSGFRAPRVFPHFSEKMEVFSAGYLLVWYIKTIILLSVSEQW